VKAPDVEELRHRLQAVTILDRHRLERRLARPGPPDLAAVIDALAGAEQRRARRAAAVPAISYPEELPVSARRAEIRDAVAAHQVVVVAGETGSGKTTQLPKICLELGRGVDGMIGHTQPRRIAARSVAERLAEELGSPVGGPVGWAVRFNDTVGEHTLVKVMTDGILLAEIRRDRRLLAYDTIIVDEAHERSLNIDFLLGYLTRLLPERPDLKVIVTSATIDTARFAAHFDAPVVEVSGRTWPVEIRYRPLEETPEDGADEDEDEQRRRSSGAARDLNQAVCDAVGELAGEGPGDVLVFLPGERDIRDAADALREAASRDLEILPLYARLSAAEQHRVFRPHRGRRVVLATNVAETSLTVPGIRFVVDSGLARISRYSHRTKVQRLPIERVSRASADQRAGRCGRLGPGTCIRLYDEDDFAARPEFTDPEILRTNLASVILQMAAIGLGEIEDFPFLEPPDRRSVADGRALLEELGAFEPGRPGHLTPVGRRLAEFPVDPRLGRMVIEAERQDCLREVTIIAAALSIQDPRERPADRAAEAAEAHRRFEVAGSDFLGYVALWDHVAEMQAELSGNQFRKRCRAEFLHVLRIREWQDLASQIRQVTRSRGVRPNREPAHPDQVHQALLAGLLSHVGMHDRVQGDFRGARNSRWQIGRGSVLHRRAPAWAVAGELVETERTWARTAARIDPRWAETIGAHLVKRSSSEAWWEPGRGEALAEERVTLYGLPIVAARDVELGRTDPAEARRIFIRRALVERDWPVSLPPLDVTAGRIESVRALEERVRRRDLLVPDDDIHAFYEARLPGHITGGRAFLRWWRRSGRHHPELLEVPLSVLVDRRGGPVELASFPDRWRQGDIELPLRYRFEPGAPDDGVTVEVPLIFLNRLSARGFDWHVPGYRQELVTALVRLLPKAVRRALGPAPDTARLVLAECSPDDGPLLPVVAARLAAMAAEPVPPAVWDVEALPPHLRITFELRHEGRILDRGEDLDGLRAAHYGEMRQALRAVAPELVRSGCTSWDFPDLPATVDRDGARAFPALVDEGHTVGVTLVESAAAQADSMWQGTRRLVLLAAPLPEAHLQRRLTNETKLALTRNGWPMGELFEDCATAVVDQMIVAHGGPPTTAVAFSALAATARRDLAERVPRVATIAGGILAAAELVLSAADRLATRHTGNAQRRAVEDVRRQVDALVRPGFVTEAGTGRLRDILRYLDAAGRRLEWLPSEPRRDAERQEVIDRLTSRYDTLLDRSAAGVGPAGAGVAEVRWMIEELRVSLWAQGLGTAAPVSEARISRAMQRLGA
jgi:ATP-dependent helicase HrpA